ncbi:MAG: hypothetical protein RDU01_03940 [Thermodesulfovibrionales bacterium]|nr:hypothetical protein [Thermodesulfovibrionales bacterium]
MFYKQELCNWDDPEEASLCLKIAGLSLRNSEYTLIGGLPSAHYFDIDSYLMENKNNATALAKLLADKINQLSKSHEFNKVAFIEKGGAGPVGLISIRSTLGTLIEKEMIIIRSKKRLLRGTIKGSLNKDDRVIILSDVATIGWTIFEAAEKVWDLGAKVPYALVVIDRDQGATVNLGRKGIELLSIYTAKTIREKKGSELKEHYKTGIEDRFIMQLVDFGGSSSTSVY